MEFFHGYTYSGHPVACAAGIATLDVYAEEGLFERARSLEPILEDAIHSLRDEPNVIDIRQHRPGGRSRAQTDRRKSVHSRDEDLSPLFLTPA